jgi:hypothetical protein
MQIDCIIDMYIRVTWIVYEAQRITDCNLKAQRLQTQTQELKNLQEY